MRVVLRRGVLLEREGVLLRWRPARSATSWRDYEFLPQALDAMRLFAKHDIGVRVVSHHPDGAAGPLTSRELEQQTQRMLLEVALGGGQIEKVYYCRHTSAVDCQCRKPFPGMLLQAMKEGFWHPPETVMIGDSEADMEAATLAGCRGILLRRDSFLTGPTRADDPQEIASNLCEAAERIVGQNVLRFDSASPAGWIRHFDTQPQNIARFPSTEKDSA